jgi:diacylglycerol kinase family enzyme
MRADAIKSDQIGSNRIRSDSIGFDRIRCGAPQPGEWSSVKALVIYNPVSGSGTSEAVSLLTEEHLSSKGWSVERVPTSGESGAGPIASRIGPRVSLVAVVGGDGSLREVIEGLGDEAHRVMIGIVPTGNANVMARELKIPLRVLDAVQLLTGGKPRAVDLGFAEGRIFLTMIGIGFDAAVVRTLSRLRRSRWGRVWYRVWADSAYALVGLWTALQPGAARLRLHCDGRGETGTFRALILSNALIYGKGWSMVPDAHFTTGKLHYQARLRSALPFVAWAVLAAMFRRRVPPSVSVYGSGRRLVVEGDRDFPLQIDGDFRGFRRRFEAEIRGGAVRLIGPVPGWKAAGQAATPTDGFDEGDD